MMRGSQSGALRWVALVAMLAFLLTSRPLAPSAQTNAAMGFTYARAPYAFSFPRDHGSHPSYRTEWWYYTGHLATADGRRFGYELTFFRFGLRPGDPQPTATQSKWRGNQVYPAHFAITDVAGNSFFYVERFAREGLGMGSAAEGKLDVRADDWTLTGAPDGKPDRERMVLHARDLGPSGTNAIDIVQLPEKPPAIHGRGGVSQKSACVSCASHYYSYTRLDSRGTLTLGGRSFAVSGISWMDHEYGSAELSPDQAGWDWFSVQLDDRRELMAYVLRQKDGSITAESSGSLIAPDGSVQYLPRDAFSVAATGTWKSPHTGAVYPSGWRVRVPSAHVDVTLSPVVDDQELAGTTGGVAYWEGAVDARDAATGRSSGTGYVELTGYAGNVSL
jgi:predicted secreted hydrolase